MISLIPLKDWLITVTLIILVFCILEIRKLKKTIAQETQKRLVPQLSLEFNSNIQDKNSGFNLVNESFFLARDIAIEDTELALTDFGFKKIMFLRLSGVNSLKTQEKIHLKLQILDLNKQLLPEVTETIIPHLISPSFKIRIYYSNVENIKFRAVFLKTKESCNIENLKIIT